MFNMSFYGYLGTILFLFRFTLHVICFNTSELNLPEEHLPYYFSNFPRQAEECSNDPSCPLKEYLNKTGCWGYEPNCSTENYFQIPKCTSHHKGWVKSKEEQFSTFFSQGDFGYIRDQLKEMRIMCEPLFKEDSSLECSDHLRFCRGRNLMLNFTGLVGRKEPLRYKMDILSEGQIGGYCRLHKRRLEDQLDQVSPLQSWAPEMRNFVELYKRPIENQDCDIVIEKPTFIMKLDAAVNMYHHFCDFFNLYASLHMNASHHDTFTTDVNILIWETYTYTSSFASSFKAFTRHPILDLKSFRGDVVCFKHVVFPLLPRMIFGLYYNTPIIHGCEGSGLFKAFSQFMLHRLGVSSKVKKSLAKRDKKIRISLLSRETSFRRILNEKELLKALKNNPDYDVQRVVFHRHIPFEKQLAITAQSDIFIGMHGAGLTHLLFLPEWAVLFELYNCEDPNCYKDLSRLRGVKYITWENKNKLVQEDEGHHPDGGAHAKFTNYEFDVEEFVRLVGKAADHVKSYDAFIALQNSTQNHSSSSINHDEF